MFRVMVSNNAFLMLLESTSDCFIVHNILQGLTNPIGFNMNNLIMGELAKSEMYLSTNVL